MHREGSSAYLRNELRVVQRVVRLLERKRELQGCRLVVLLTSLQQAVYQVAGGPLMHG